MMKSDRLLKRHLMSSVVLFLLAAALWLQNTSQETKTPIADKPIEFYSNQTQDNLTRSFINAIDEATHSIMLVVYSLTDPQIIEALKNKSLQGIDVKVVCDAKASPYIDSKLGSKVSTIRRFGPGLMHQKILVVDKCKTWIGSANMTTDSLRLHSNLVTALYSPTFANKVLAKANSLEIEGRTTPFSHETFQIGKQTVELWFLPDNPDAALKLKSLIKTAKKTLRIAMFTWTRQDLAKAVIAASKRGVDTEVVIDYYSGKGAGSKVIKLLKDNGISVGLSRGGALLHHKFLYIDDKILVNGSANWTKAAFTQNDDCFIVIQDLTEEQSEQMKNLWEILSSERTEIK